LAANDTVRDTVKNLGEAAGEQIKSRLKSHYFSYILTSLVAYNWQNILVLLKSTRNIETILETWNKAPGFTYDFIILPVLVGYIASFILPMLAIPVAWITSLVAENIDIADIWSKNIIERYKARIERRTAEFKRRAIFSSAALEEIEADIDSALTKRDTLLEHKKMLDEYIASLSQVYMEMKVISSPEDLERFFELVKEKGLLQAYPANSIVNMMVDNIYYLRGSREDPPST